MKKYDIKVAIYSEHKDIIHEKLEEVKEKGRKF